MSRPGLLLSVFDDPVESLSGAADEAPTPVEETPLYRAGHAAGLDAGRKAADEAVAAARAEERRELDALRAALAEAVGAARESAVAAGEAAAERQSALFAAALRAVAPRVADAAFIEAAVKALTAWRAALGGGSAGPGEAAPSERGGVRLQVSSEKRDALAAALAGQPAPLADLTLEIDPALRGAAMRLTWADGLAELNPERCADAIVALLPAAPAEPSAAAPEPASVDEPAAEAADATVKTPSG